MQEWGRLSPGHHQPHRSLLTSSELWGVPGQGSIDQVPFGWIISVIFLLSLVCKSYHLLKDRSQTMEPEPWSSSRSLWLSSHHGDHPHSKNHRITQIGKDVWDHKSTPAHPTLPTVHHISTFPKLRWQGLFAAHQLSGSHSQDKNLKKNTKNDFYEWAWFFCQGLLTNLPVIAHNIHFNKIFALFSAHKFPQYFRAFLNKINPGAGSVSAHCFQAFRHYLLHWLSPKMSKGMQGHCSVWIVYVWNSKHRWCRLGGWPVHPWRVQLDFQLDSFLLKWRGWMGPAGCKQWKSGAGQAVRLWWMSLSVSLGNYPEISLKSCRVVLK